jgi:hypothetical protein
MAYLSDGDTQTLAAKNRDYQSIPCLARCSLKKFPVLKEHLQLLDFNEPNLQMGLPLMTPTSCSQNHQCLRHQSVQVYSFRMIQVDKLSAHKSINSRD